MLAGWLVVLLGALVIVGIGLVVLLGNGNRFLHLRLSWGCSAPLMPIRLLTLGLAVFFGAFPLPASIILRLAFIVLFGGSIVAGTMVALFWVWFRDRYLDGLFLMFRFGLRPCTVITRVRSITFSTSRGFRAASSVVADCKHFGKVKVRLEVVVAGWILSQLFPEGFDVQREEKLVCSVGTRKPFYQSLTAGAGWSSRLLVCLQTEMIGFFE
jgi:hypothetical protein